MKRSGSVRMEIDDMRSLLLAALVPLAACTTTVSQHSVPVAGAPAASDGYDLAVQRAKVARVPMTPDTSFLTTEERQVVNLLNQAANLMSEIYLRQMSEDNPRVRAEIAASNRPYRAALL